MYVCDVEISSLLIYIYTSAFNKNSMNEIFMIMLQLCYFIYVLHIFKYK